MVDLAKLVHDLPFKPGVYIWKNERGNPIYVGKAKELRKRVSSYLRKRGLDRKTWELMREAKDLETIITDTEREALFLESTLIQKHKPKYNLAFKDDKRHTWIRVDRSVKFPTFEVTREIDIENAEYHGPFRSTKRLDRTLDHIRRYIPIAMCKDPSKEKRECIDYHVERCVGPCGNHISVEEYEELVEEMCLYLDGDLAKLVEHMTLRMDQASNKMEFEKAASLRDQIEDIKRIMLRQRVIEFEGPSRDVLGISRTEQAALVELLIIRNGLLIGTDQFFIEVDLDTSDTEIITLFIEQYHFKLPRLPDEILLPVKIPQMSQLAGWLSEDKSHTVEIVLPKEGRIKDLVNMANTNADRALRKILILDERSDFIVHNGVKHLKDALGLSHAPVHIEGFDIANIQGTDPTGSCVVFKNGAPDKSNYRMFRVRIKDTPDDYAMMNEVVYRRYFGVLQRNDPLPDLILIDGGKGQLNVASKALEDLGLDNLAVAGLAKRNEILFTRDNPDGIALDWNSPGLHLVQQVRDEAHRFAQRYHHKLREKRVSGSILEEAPGIGKKRRQALLKAFGSYDKIREASVEFLSMVDGMTEKAAKDLREWLDKEDPL
jgi:excinuclease ABC subunit C